MDPQWFQNLPKVTEIVANTLEIALQRRLYAFNIDQCEQMLTEDSSVQQHLQKATKLNEEKNIEEKFFLEAEKVNKFNKRALDLLKKASKVLQVD